MGGGTFVGRVVSNRMQKTVVVAVDYVVWQPKLKVYEKRTSKHFAHDEQQGCDIGDTVRITWTPRRSKHKHYNVEEVLRKVQVYSPAFGAQQAAAADDAAKQAAAAAAAGKPLASRLELLDALVDAADKHLKRKQQQLRELRAAHDQDAAAAAAMAGRADSSKSSSKSSSGGSSGGASTQQQPPPPPAPGAAAGTDPVVS